MHVYLLFQFLLNCITGIEYIVPESLLIPVEERNYQFYVKQDIFALFTPTTIFYPGVISVDSKNANSKSSCVVQFDTDEKECSAIQRTIDNKYVFSKDHILASMPNCGICSHRLKNRLNVPYSKCVECDKAYSFHANCVDMYATTYGGNYNHSDVIADYKQMKNFICQGCLQKCFICGCKHPFDYKNATLYKCPTCPVGNKATCIISVSRRNAMSGCISKLPEDGKKKYLAGNYGCFECRKHATCYKYDTKRVFNDNMKEDLETDLLNIIEDTFIQPFIKKSKSSKDLLNMRECHSYCRKYLSHLDTKTENIFMLNSPTSEKWNGLFLTAQTITNFMQQDYIVDEDLFNCVTFLLNGLEYKRAVLDGAPDAQNTFFYTQFGSTYLDAEINPLRNQATLKKYRKNRQTRPKIAKPAHNAFLLSTLKKWKKGIYEDFFVQRDFNVLHSIYTEETKPSNKPKSLWNIVIPVQNHHKSWRLMDVQFPSASLPNGNVDIIDCNNPAASHDWSDIMAPCFYAKFFGLCWHKSIDVSAITDMTQENFSKATYTEKKKLYCDTLDHFSFQFQNSNKRPMDMYENSGLYVLFQMIGMQLIKYRDIYGDDGLTIAFIEEYKATLQSCLMTTIIKIIKLLNDKPKFVYEPNSHDCDDNVKIWMECRRLVENKKVELKDIWVPFKEKSDLSRSQLPNGVGNKVDFKLLQPHKFYGGKPDYDYMNLFQRDNEKPRPIGKSGGKLFSKKRGGDAEPLKCVLVKLILDCFEVNESRLKRHEKYKKVEMMKVLEDHITHCLMHFTTILLVDHEKIIEYIQGGKEVPKYQSKTDEVYGNKTVHPVDIFAILIVEKTVEVEKNYCSLVHFLCVKRGYEGLGYAKKLLVFSMKDPELKKKDFYLVSKLPHPYKVKNVKPLHMNEETYKKWVKAKSKNNFYKYHKVGEYYRGSECHNLVFKDAEMLFGNSDRFASMPLGNVTNSSSIYIVDNNTKHSIVCTEEGTFYSRNAFFGWFETSIELLKYYNVPDTKIKLAREHIMKEIVLYEAGAKSSVLGKDQVDELAKGLELPLEYQQTTYGNDLHGCVWLSVCQVLYNVNREQSELLLNEYIIKPERFQFLTIFQPKKTGSNSLDKMMKEVKGCRYRVIHVKPGQVDLTKYVLEERTAGVFVAVLEDTFGGHGHCVGINKATDELFDPMEQKVMSITKDTLDIACGRNRSFRKLKYVGELDEYRFNQTLNTKRKRKKEANEVHK